MASSYSTVLWNPLFVLYLRHPREDVYERIETILLILLREGDHLETEREKSSVEEAVHQEHLT